jgi:uncharacterized protein (TIGR03089 family)
VDREQPAAAQRSSGGIAGLIDRQASRQGDKPFLTWYGDEASERVELSYRTFENWTAKVANLLVEELGAGPGDRVGTVLGGHWRGAAIAFACWRAGACLVPLDPDAPAGAQAARLRETGCLAAFVAEGRLGAVAERLGPAPGRPALVAVGLDLLGRTGADPATAVDFARVVPGMGDVFEGEGTSPVDEALLPGDGGDRPLSQGDLLAWAGRVVAGLGLDERGRLYTGLPAHLALGAVSGLAAPFLAGTGVVVEQALAPAGFWKRVADERVAAAVLTAAQVEALLEAAQGPAPVPGAPGATATGGAPGPGPHRLRVVACDLEQVPGPLALAWQRRFGLPLSPVPGAAASTPSGQRR